MNFIESHKLLARALEVIPIASQTFSKNYKYFVLGASPIFLQRGKGSHVWDVDNNKFLDYILGLGAITLGYNHPEINLAIWNQMVERGIVFSQPSPLETEMAEKLIDIIPCAEMARFLKTGSEATQAAIRAARAYTGRSHIAFRGYHGWHSWYSITTERNKGIPLTESQYMHQFEYNNIGSLEVLFEDYDLAAVIMEPMIVESPKPGFLETIRELCSSYKTVLIFDEIVTGFRWSLGGAQEYFRVVPDLATFGKGMANGMPLACVCGKKEIMREFEDIFVSSTLGGECLSLAAGLATIREMQKKDTIKHNWDMGRLLMDGLKDIGISSTGFPCRPILQLENDTPHLRSLLMQELIKRDILIHNGLLINLCASHTKDDIDHAISAFGDSMKAIESGVELEGEVVKTAFRRL